VNARLSTTQLAARLRLDPEAARALLRDEQHRGHVVALANDTWTLTAEGRRAVEPFLVATTKIVDP
jgi:hypothetical protein